MLSLLELNVLIELCCAAFCVICLLCVRLFFHAQLWYRDLLMALFVFVFVSAVSDVVAIVYDGHPERTAWWCTRIFRAVSLITEFATAGTFTSYLCARLDKGRITDPWVKFVWLICVAASVMVVLGVFYSFDYDTNLYRPSDRFWITQFLGLFIMIGDVFVLLSLARSIPLSTFVSLLICIVMPAIALAFQYLIKDLNLLRFSMAVSLMVLFFEVQTYIATLITRQRERIALQERELSDSRVQIMISQIQPHFLYNTLDSIYYLCRKDPEMAREAISRFSDYLRANLRSLAAEKPVPFETELNHVQNYLELERMSSDDTINFVVDAQTTAFMIPALSLQPLVENAVKHGLGGKSGGGTVRLSSREVPGFFEVEVADDGAGFDVNAVPDTSRPHVGIQNVRQRIESMCGGTLEITSELGVGTTATIRIPKKR